VSSFTQAEPVAKPVVIVPVAQAPVRLLERLMGFAESLDDPVLDVVPVMSRVRQEVVVDPLPWER